MESHYKIRKYYGGKTVQKQRDEKIDASCVQSNASINGPARDLCNNGKVILFVPHQSTQWTSLGVIERLGWVFRFFIDGCWHGGDRANTLLEGGCWLLVYNVGGRGASRRRMSVDKRVITGVVMPSGSVVSCSADQEQDPIPDMTE